MRGRLGQGCLVLVVGPSGAGKDTLIRLARAELAGEPRYVFPRRLVTRPPSGDEDNDEIDEAAFLRGQAEGRFALCWRAHGLGYAVPAEAGRLVEAGRVVVSNVSRGIVGAARGLGLPLSVVLVTAPADVLARRIAARGRAQDGDPAGRLARPGASAAEIAADLTVPNVGPPREAADRLVGHLRTR